MQVFGVEERAEHRDCGHTSAGTDGIKSQRFDGSMSLGPVSTPVWRWRNTTSGQTGRKLHLNWTVLRGQVVNVLHRSPRRDRQGAGTPLWRPPIGQVYRSQLKAKIQLTDESIQTVCHRHGPDGLPCLSFLSYPSTTCGRRQLVHLSTGKETERLSYPPFVWRQIAGRRPRLRPEIRSSEGGSLAACKDRIQHDGTASLLSGSGCRPSQK